LVDFAGEFAVGPLVHGTIASQSFWIYTGVAFALVALLSLFATPAHPRR
jgi:hypothetical protein